MNELHELCKEELSWVAGGDGGTTVVSGPAGSYVDNGSSCSPGTGGGSGAGGTPALNANTGIRG